jgi:dienelactone hydrolase
MNVDTSLTRAEVEQLTVPQLKQQLRLRGSKVSGRKSDLIDRLLQYCASFSPPIEPQVIRNKGKSSKKKKTARELAEERGKELIDVTAYLDEDDQGKAVKSSVKEEGDEEPVEESTGPEVWGVQAKIVDDYEGRQVVVDNLSRTIVEYKGSNNTQVKAYVVASRDALKNFLAGGEQSQNTTETPQDRLREIQLKREMAARVPVRSLQEDAGLDEGDETGLYENVIERDVSDWGIFTQTGAQLSACEVQGVLLLSDVYGAFTDDTRFLAEKIAFECQPVVVMVPDLFRDEPWTEDKDGFNKQGQTYEQWRAMHSDLRVSIDIRAAAACLRERYGVSSVVVWGTCYGGGRALEAASGYFPNDNIHDVDGRVGPPPVDPMAAVAWYPTRYNARELFGKTHKGSYTDNKGENRSVAVMAIFAEKDVIPGATPDCAAELKSLLAEDDRIKDHMVKVFPGQEHGFAHIGISDNQGISDDPFERFVDEEFGGAGQMSMNVGDAEVACLLSTAWMETYSRVFLPTSGPPVSLDDNEGDWTSLEMKDLSDANQRDIRTEIEEALDGFVEEPLGGKRIDPTDESQKEELSELLRSMQTGEVPGPYTIKPEDDLTLIYAKLKASDENFQIF